MKHLLNLLLLTGVIVSSGMSAGVVSLTEVSENCTTRDLDSTRNHFLVDVNSIIDIKVNTSEFTVENDPAMLLKIDSLKSQMQCLKSVLDTARAFQTTATQIVTVYQKLQQQEQSDKADEFSRLVQRHGGLGLYIFNSMDSLGISKEKQRRVVRMPGQVDYYKGLADLLIESIQITEKKTEELKLELATNDSLLLRIWCIQFSQTHEPAQIHLDNYDNVPAGDYRPIDKVTLSRTPQEEAYLQKSAQLNADVIRFYEDIRNSDSGLRKMLDKLTRDAQKDFRDIGTLFDVKDLQALLDDGLKEIKALPESPEVAQLLTDLKVVQDQLNTIKSPKKEYEDLTAYLNASEGDPMALFNWFQAKKDFFRTLQSKLEGTINPDRIQQISTAVERLALSLKKVAETHADAKLNEISSFVNDKYRKWQTNIDGLRQVLQTYQTLADQVEQVVGSIKNSMGFASRIEAGSKANPEAPVIETIDVPLNSALPTSLDLTRTNREENDRFNLHVLAYRKTDQSQNPVGTADYTFRVLKMGFYSKWLGSLLFVKMDQGKKYLPATSVSWLLHYRTLKGNGLLSNTVNLGFGISSAVMSVDNKIEYGAGPTISVLSDILQAGYGFNIQQHEPYFFFGVALLDLLQATRVAGEMK